MEKLLKLIVTSIVQKPKLVKITRQEKDGLLEFSLQVDPDDMKIVIGKKGRTIKAIRNLLRLRAIKENIRVNLELLEKVEKDS
jgi:predicted RNA-binding protein YlqC (UPF0109 family)